MKFIFCFATSNFVTVIRSTTPRYVLVLIEISPR